ncbi:GGDEF domain-containing protein [Paracidobacterium acidisoli]|uniref:GGDEF domain-containing protein n=1 Tax=Paracidobacterium acidisoli TaxID=2303751 RepID=UPI0011C1B2B8|nr:diguanylate cyclase [Paracidobacterium acidisoli]
MSSSHGSQVQNRGVRALSLVLLFTLIYLTADFALNKFAFSDGWTVLWPLNGVTIALLLMWPRLDWPAILVGVTLGTGIGECLDHNPVTLELWLRTFSLIEVLICAWLLPPFTSLDDWLRRTYLFPRFFAALLLGPGISGVMAAILFHHVHHEPWLMAFNDWATADALGIAAIMPLALCARSTEMRTLFKGHALPRTIGILVTAFTGIVLIFTISRYPLLFLLYPILLYVDSMLAFAGSAIAMPVVCLLAVYFTIHGHGPFAFWPQGLLVSRNVALQIYLGFHMVALFPASVLFMERRRMSEDLRDANAQLTMLASVDGLTGIANRRSLDERFSMEWKRAIRVRTSLALLMIDLDHFKQYNDMYGHHAGDQCLRTIAGVLSRHLRRPQDFVARFGGEEFAILLPHTDLDGARHLAETIRIAVLEAAVDHDGSSWGCVTVSVGCAAILPAHGDDRFRLLQTADAALYLAKKAGRNCIEISEPVDEPAQ